MYSLEDFLIKESKINKEFIKDFFGIQKNMLYEKYKPFIIDLDDIAYWLDAKKGNLKDTLIKNYLNKFDYIIISSLLVDQKQNTSLRVNPDQTKKGGQNKETVLLTTECFKMLCMRSNTKKANKVRQYYIALEKLIDEYKDNLITHQTKKIEILENDLKKEPLPKEGYCYIYLETDELGYKYYRLGQSGNLQKRFNNHNSSSVHKKILSYKIKTDNILHFEACLRGIMFDYRYKNNKDYYKISEDKIKEAINYCKKIVKEFKNDIIGGDKNKKDIEVTFDIKKINNEIAKMFSYSCECVNWNMYDKPNKAYYNGKKITDNKLKEKILPSTTINKLLIVPVHRFGEYIEIINLGNHMISYQKLFNILYKYYNKDKINLDTLNKIPDDIDDHKKDAIKKYKSKKDVFRIDLIGSLCRFENVRQTSDNIYELILGS
jgi:hypothetical protein